jgi:quercetin dioxygenase-like cupin family protein
MQRIHTSYLLIILFSLQLNAQEKSIFPKGEVSNTNNHTGTVWLNELNKPDTTFNYSIAVATFDKGAKLDWHIHPAGQILLITDGTGYYQEEGKPITVVKKGDVIKCQPGVTHWHGATPQNSFTYLATTPAQKGKTIWLKRVTEEEYNGMKPVTMSTQNMEQEITRLSKQKWQWMSEKNTDSLSKLFNEHCVFVHMGGSWGKEQEINIIKSGGIWYKKADVHTATVNIIDNTAILLSDITLLAEVGGNEVTNPFIVTEVYIEKEGKWQLGSLSFTKKLTP